MKCKDLFPPHLFIDAQNPENQGRGEIPNKSNGTLHSRCFKHIHVDGVQAISDVLILETESEREAGETPKAGTLIAEEVTVIRYREIT